MSSSGVFGYPTLGNPYVAGAYAPLYTSSANLLGAQLASGQGPLQQLEAQQQALQSDENAYTPIVNALQSLGAFAQSSLGTTSDLMPPAATSSDSSVTAVAGSDAQPGSYTVDVGTLATAQTNLSNGFSSATQAGLLGTGSVSIQAGSNSPIDLAVSNTSTLQDLANEINSANGGVTASILFDGSDYHLEVAGGDTGTANSVNFTETDITAGSNGNNLGFGSSNSQIQSATDATLTLDGSVPITSASNTVNDVIPGVTLQLNAPSTNPATVTVADDTSSVENTVQDFVSQYNSVVSSINTAVQNGNPTDPSNPANSTTLQTLQGQLANVVSTSVPGAIGSYSALSQIGITSNSDGTLQVNANQLASATASDPSSVAQLFAGTTGVSAQVQGIASDYAAAGTGALNVTTNAMQEQQEDNQLPISDDEYDVTTYQEMMQQQYADLQQQLSEYSAQSAFSRPLPIPAGVRRPSPYRRCTTCS